MNDRIRESTGGSVDEHWTAVLELSVADFAEVPARVVALEVAGYRAGRMGKSRLIRFWPVGKRNVFKTRAPAIAAARAALAAAPAEATADVCHFQPFSKALRKVMGRIA
jgi:hypothetical protein